MTPKEKAEQLLNRFYFDTTLDELEQAKDCTIIAVDEIIKFGNEQGIREPMMYWYKVKQELEKL
jgi:hypothetical protein